MAWTVPNGCYYAVCKTAHSGTEYNYYSAGQSVPTQYAPNTMIPDFSSAYPFMLIDFTNGYIYTTFGQNATVTITIGNNNTFTITGNGSWGYDVHVLASDYAVYNITRATMAGEPFTFGNGSNIMDKFTVSSWRYSMAYAFGERTDITSVTIPSGAVTFHYAFKGCTNLVSVSGTLTDMRDVHYMFYGCTSLVNLPTFYSIDELASNHSLQYAFYGCSSLVSPPNIPVGITGLSHCFEDCTSLASAPTIPSSVTTIAYCFSGCTSLATPSSIPNSVTNLNRTFYGCTSLTTAPTIPASVTTVSHCFEGCTALTTAPTIPANITYSMEACFKDCTSLAGMITIDATPTYSNYVFSNTQNEIVLVGQSALLDTIASSYNNVYVWSLSVTLTAERDTNTFTTIPISVGVTWYKTGNLSSLNLYRDSGTTPMSVTWNDPTLAMSSTTGTFTTTLTNVAESDSFLLSVVATDTYGSSTTVSVKIPIAFFTIDVQAGGKEIAFGSIANDDISDIHGKDFSTEGLFKCTMGTDFNDMTAQEVEEFVDGLDIGGGAGQVVVVEDQSKLESADTGTLTLKNCTGTISHNQIYFTKLASGLWFINGRLNINSFTRSGANPGVYIALPSSVPTPTKTQAFICGFRSQSPREGVVFDLNANSRTATLITHESFTNAQNGTLTFIVNGIFTLD